MSAARTVPPQRIEAFATVAEVTKHAAVIVFCRNTVVAHQYRVGVAAAGGNPENLRFLHPKRGRS